MASYVYYVDYCTSDYKCVFENGKLYWSSWNKEMLAWESCECPNDPEVLKDFVLGMTREAFEMI